LAHFDGLPEDMFYRYAYTVNYICAKAIMKNLKNILGITALLAVIGFAALNWYVRTHDKPTKTSAIDSRIAYGGSFSLINQDGQRVDESILKGKWTLVFFGYTYCPDICPLTLQNLEASLKLVGPRGKDVQIIFVSVDPERDKPQDLKDYLSSRGFPQGVIGLTGSPEEIASIAKSYRVSYQKVGTGKDYTINHTAVIYLMNPDGAFVLPLSHDLSPEKNAALIKNAMAGK
jgi:protein SCO1/2